MWRAVGKIMMWRCIHDGESRVVFSLKKVVCALVSANFAAARAVRVEFFHCKGGGRAAKRVIFNVISGLVFWPCCKFSAGVYPLSCSRPHNDASFTPRRFVCLKHISLQHPSSLCSFVAKTERTTMGGCGGPMAGTVGVWGPHRAPWGAVGAPWGPMGGCARTAPRAIAFCTDFCHNIDFSGFC